MGKVVRINDPEYDADALRRFMSKVIVSNDPNDCWIWAGPTLKKGYGFFKYRGKNVKAHRFIYMWFHGPVPSTLLIMHSCDCPNCVNPVHLSVGTIQDNNADRDRKGRHGSGRVGEDHHMHRLVASDVIKMRSLYAQGDSTRSLARQFGVSQRAAYMVVSGLSWRHV